jgi:UDP-N-acetylmuramate: L-alanyl-gamma-D-glutamyl-meso-diaminopimelate ligase
MGVDEAEFYELKVLKGLKKIRKNCRIENSCSYKDFAHSPSKVAATTKR